MIQFRKVNSNVFANHETLVPWLRENGFIKTSTLIDLHRFIRLDKSMANAFNLTTNNIGKSDLNQDAKIFGYREIEHPEDGKKYSIQESQINTLVIHTTSLEDANCAIKTYHAHGVSAHFIIDTNGYIYLLVPLELCAYHAGQSSFSQLHKIGIKDYGSVFVNTLNYTSIGIELLTPEFSSITKEQVASYRKLTIAIRDVYPSVWYSIAHSTIAPIRKCDPQIIAMQKIVEKDNLDTILLPQRLSDELHDYIVDFFYRYNTKTIEQLYDIRDVLREIGYSILGSQEKVLKLIVYSLIDYIKCTTPDVLIESQLIQENVNNILSIRAIKSYFDTLEVNEKDNLGIIQVLNSKKFSDYIAHLSIPDAIIASINKIVTQDYIENLVFKHFNDLKKI